MAKFGPGIEWLQQLRGQRSILVALRVLRKAGCDRGFLVVSDAIPILHDFLPLQSPAAAGPNAHCCAHQKQQ